MQEIVSLKITIEYTGNLEAAKEELNRAVQKCNCLCSGYQKNDSFRYKVISSEVYMRDKYDRQNTGYYH